MAITINYLGHSGFVIGDGRHSVVVDPYLTDNPVAVQKPADIRCQYIALSHGHEDHVGDTVSIARANKAKVIGAWELCNFLQRKGCAVEPGNPGGRIATDFGWVALTQAFHSASYHGEYMGNPCGLMIHIGGVTIYHCGDTNIFGDMKLLSEIYQPQIACIPVGDRFTMGPELGARAAELIKPRVAIPIHYRTFPLLASDISAFRPQGVQVKQMNPGETWSYG